MNRHATTYAGLLRPTVGWPATAYDAALVLGGSLFVALAAAALPAGWKLLRAR